MSTCNNLELINKQFNNLTIISILPGKGKTKCLCKCICNKEITVLVNSLMSNNTKSCGCRNNQSSINNLKLAHKKNTKLPPDISSANKIFIKRYSDGDLTLDQFLYLTKLPCHYCSSTDTNSFNYFTTKYTSSQFSKDNGTYSYNGLDRVDSTLPHNYNNVIPCCIVCNRAKSNMQYSDFISYLKRLK